MTGVYLEKLRALKTQNRTLDALPKLTKRGPTVEPASCTTKNWGFGSFDSARDRAPSNFPERYSRVMAALEARCPDLVPTDRWQLAIDDGRRFLAGWGAQAEAFSWTSKDLFGLHQPPTNPPPSYSRLSRYDETGLIWLLTGRQVIALTAATSAIQNPTGTVTTYRRFNKPALGPVGHSLDDLDPPFGGGAE